MTARREAAPRRVAPSLNQLFPVAASVAVYDVRGRAGVDRLAGLVLERALSRPGRPV